MQMKSHFELRLVRVFFLSFSSSSRFSFLFFVNPHCNLRLTFTISQNVIRKSCELNHLAGYQMILGWLDWQSKKLFKWCDTWGGLHPTYFISSPVAVCICLLLACRTASGILAFFVCVLEHIMPIDSECFLMHFLCFVFIHTMGISGSIFKINACLFTLFKWKIDLHRIAFHIKSEIAARCLLIAFRSSYDCGCHRLILCSI